MPTKETETALSLAPDLYCSALDNAWTFVSWQGQLDTLRATLNEVFWLSSQKFSVKMLRQALL